MKGIGNRQKKFVAPKRLPAPPPAKVVPKKKRKGNPFLKPS